MILHIHMAHCSFAGGEAEGPPGAAAPKELHEGGDAPGATMTPKRDAESPEARAPAAGSPPFTKDDWRYATRRARPSPS